MLNYAALHITNYYLKQIPGSDSTKTVDLNPGALLESEFLRELTNAS